MYISCPDKTLTNESPHSGYDGFRVRTSAYRPPTGHEVSFLYDPPIEGPEDGKPRGLSFDTRLNGSQPIVIRNGNMLFKTTGLGSNYWLSFYRIEANGTETLILNEYIPGTLSFSLLN